MFSFIEADLHAAIAIAIVENASRVRRKFFIARKLNHRIFTNPDRIYLFLSLDRAFFRLLGTGCAQDCMFAVL